jgi:hypothetical protein
MEKRKNSFRRQRHEFILLWFASQVFAFSLGLLGAEIASIFLVGYFITQIETIMISAVTLGVVTYIGGTILGGVLGVIQHYRLRHYTQWQMKHWGRNSALYGFIGGSVAYITMSILQNVSPLLTVPFGLVAFFSVFGFFQMLQLNYVFKHAARWWVAMLFGGQAIALAFATSLNSVWLSPMLLVGLLAHIGLTGWSMRSVFEAQGKDINDIYALSTDGEKQKYGQRLTLPEDELPIEGDDDDLAQAQGTHPVEGDDERHAHIGKHR